MTDELGDADLVRIAVDDAPVLDSDTVERIQFLLAPHLSAFTEAEAETAAVTDLPATERREAPGRAA